MELTPAEGKLVTQYHDAESLLLQRVDMELPTMQKLAMVQTRLANYLDLDALKSPFAVAQDLPTGQILVKYSEVKCHVDIGATKVTKPIQ